MVYLMTNSDRLSMLDWRLALRWPPPAPYVDSAWPAPPWTLVTFCRACMGTGVTAPWMIWLMKILGPYMASP